MSLLLTLWTTSLIGCDSGNLPSLDSSISSSGSNNSSQQESQSSDSEIEVVQEDARQLMNATFQRDATTSLAYMHPKLIEMMGGQSQAKRGLEQVFSQFPPPGARLESVNFPEEITFLNTNRNYFVIVPYQIIILVNGQRIENVSYLIGNKEHELSDWKYIKGTQINQENIRMLFPDFPTDYRFPETYTREI